MHYHVCSVVDVPRGEKRAYTVKNISVLLVHSETDEFYALYRICPHQRGDFNYGALVGLNEAEQAGADFHYTRGGEVLRCPLHSFSFDVTTGVCLTAPEKLRVRTYPVIVREQEVFLDI